MILMVVHIFLLSNHTDASSATTPPHSNHLAVAQGDCTSHCYQSENTTTPFVCTSGSPFPITATLCNPVKACGDAYFLKKGTD